MKFKDFGRRSVLALRQNLSARILELEKDNIYNKYKDKVGQIVIGEVYQIWKKEMLILDDEGNELIMPKQRTDNRPTSSRKATRCGRWSSAWKCGTPTLT